MHDRPEHIRKFYGRSKGKALSIGKKEALTSSAVHLQIELGSSSELNFSQIFGCSYSAYELEIGFGSGEHLLHRAALYPEIGFIGVEPFLNGFAAALRDAVDQGLTNVRFYNDDAHFLIKKLPNNSFAKIHLNYPDPWHKKRHWKRRFISHEIIVEFERMLVAGGEFRLATDIDSYAAWTLMHMEMAKQLRWQAQTADDYTQPFPDWVTTRYEMKARREGRSSCYLRFLKN